MWLIQKSDCSEEVRLLDLVIPAGIKNGLRNSAPLPAVESTSRKGKAHWLSIIDRGNINRVLQHDEGLWWNLGIWVRKSGAFSNFQIGITYSIATYAAGDLVETPSAKQSKHCAVALDIASDEGFKSMRDMD